HLDVSGAHTWGETGLRFVARRGIDVEIHAHGADGTPVNGFGVRLFETADGLHGGNSEWVRSSDPADLVKLRGERRRSTAMILGPPDPAFAMTTLLPVAIDGPGPQRVDVVVPRRLARSVCVQRADGTPVAGSQLRLVDSFDRPTALDGVVTPLQRWTTTNQS